MGGNFRHSEAPTLPTADRISVDVYENAINEIDDKLFWDSELFRWAFPHQIGEKEDFGDIDILIPSNEMEAARNSIGTLTWKNPETGESYLKQLTHPESQDSFMITYEFRGTTYNIQVDLIPTNSETFDFAFGYFSYNDLGNLIGRVAHRRGFKFGHDGLWYIHRRGDRVIGEYRFPLTFAQALEELGFDALQWAMGFDSYEDAFNWVKNSKYFDPSAFPLEHRNHRSRTRDAKRKTYMMFLQWLNFDGEYVESKREAIIDSYRKTDQTFNAALTEFEKADDLRIAYRDRINGEVVGVLTNLQGKELGSCMNFVREVLPMTEDTLKLSNTAIYAGILFAFEKYKQNVGITKG